MLLGGVDSCNTPLPLQLWQSFVFGIQFLEPECANTTRVTHAKGRKSHQQRVRRRLLAEKPKLLQVLAENAAQTNIATVLGLTVGELMKHGKKSFAALTYDIENVQIDFIPCKIEEKELPWL